MTQVADSCDAWPATTLPMAVDPSSSLRQVIILERDEQLPDRAAHEAYTDGSEYAKDGRARRGVPQYVQVHAITAKVGQALIPTISQHLQG